MKKYLGIISIVLVGLILRLICLDKADGLWNDEYVSFMIAATPLGERFAKIMGTQCHLPFYYLYLKFFMFLFDRSDLLLRLTSVIPGIISIIAMYFVGREHNKNTAYLCAGFTAISSFLVYYSQEVRFYSLLFLFSAISLLFTLRLVKNPDKKNIVLYSISNLLILITHTIGFVFIFFNLIYISTNLYKQYKKIIITIWSVLFVGFLTLFPMLHSILNIKFYTQWWGKFSLSKIGFLFTDYFSPVLTNLVNAPENMFYAPNLAFLMIFPAIIAIGLIIRAVYKNKNNLQLLLICIGTILILVLASMLGKLVFITKYSIEIYPILIYLACFGCANITNKTLKKWLVGIYCLISIGYLILSPHSAPKLPRPEGHKHVANMLKQLNMKDGDVLLFQYYNFNRFHKYIDYKNYKVASIEKGNFHFYLSDDAFEDAYFNGKNTYRDVLKLKDNSYLKNKLKKEIFNDLKPGQSVAVIMLDSVSFYNDEEISQIVNDDELYEKTPLLFLIFSYIKLEVFKDMMEELTIVGGGQKGSWRILKFTKLNN